jgi:hypothetical protein
MKRQVKKYQIVVRLSSRKLLAGQQSTGSTYSDKFLHDLTQPWVAL